MPPLQTPQGGHALHTHTHITCTHTPHMHTDHVLLGPSHFSGGQNADLSRENHDLKMSVHIKDKTIIEVRHTYHTPSHMPTHVTIHLKALNETNLMIPITLHTLTLHSPSQLKHQLSESHAQIKQLNLLLTEKKEAILKYQEQITDLQADNGELRHQMQLTPQVSEQCAQVVSYIFI